MNGFSEEPLNGLVVTKRQYELPKHGDGAHSHRADSHQGSPRPGDRIAVVQDARGRIITGSDYHDAALLDKMTIEDFSDYIARERLNSMPHRGSLWDRVLRWAEFYALQIATYTEIISSFAPESRDAAMHIFTLLRSLLELGENNAAALNTTFGVFYKLGRSLSFLSSNQAMLISNIQSREHAARAFHDIHNLVFDVASYYQRSVQGLSNGSVTLDLVSLVRVNLDSFYGRKSSIIDHMWRHALGEGASQDIQKVRKWLNQRSCLLKTISTDRHTQRAQYDEYTCEWFQRHLLQFTRGNEDVLAITAPAGSGKSTLSTWIQERLQRPMDRKIHNTIMFTFEPDVPRESTSLALAKSLALQLLDTHIGNTEMFESILEASTSNGSVTVETNLWTAIDAAFYKSTEPTMIIIDGLDHLRGGNMGAVCDRISKLSIKHTSLKSIILSRPNPALLASNKKWKIFEITPDHVYEDVQHIAKHALRSCEQYLTKRETERQAVVEQLVKDANGSFLWLLLTTDMLRRSRSIEDFEKNLTEAPKTLDETIKKHADSIEFSDVDTKLMLSLILVAERPLTVPELYEILQVDLQRKSNTNRQIDVEDKVASTGGLVCLDVNEVVRFRHSAIRSYFLTLQAKGEKVLNFKDAQTQLTLRMLVYSKAYLKKKHDVSLESLPNAEAERVCTEHKLIEYVVRNWIHHIRQSSFFNTAGTLELTSDFKALFPKSSYMVLLEWTCWDEQASNQEIIDMHDHALRIRSDVFGQKHESTLQNIITCGFIHHERSSVNFAADYFLQASRIGQSILPKFSKITISCTVMFLTITEAHIFTSRTEIVTYREEMLKFMIAAYKHEHGETSDLVIRYYKALAELYVCIQEEENAAECWKELRIIIVKKHGEGSDAEREISGKLTVVLKGKQDFEIEQYRGDIFDIGEDSAVVWDAVRITMFLKLALACENRKEWHEAEEVYVTLWTRLLHLCRQQYSNDTDFRIGVLGVAIQYAYFLQRRQRLEEAKNILIIIWTEHQHFGCESMAFYLQLKDIGQLMRTLGLDVISVSVFEKVVQWFTAVGKHDDEELHRCQQYILEIVEDITKKEASPSGETTEGLETIMRRMFSSATVVTKEYIKIVRTAVHLYVKKEQWSDAISVLTKALALIWTESSWGGEICLPNEFVDEAIEFAIELGKCYMKCKHYQESLACYLQLWQAVRTSCSFDDKRRKVIVDALVGFYTEHRRWKLLIELHKEQLVEYRRHLGKSHDHTIGLLYVIGALVLEHGHGQAEDYYREIVEVIGTSNPKASFKAYTMLCQIYYDESHWVELKTVCDVLWNLLIHHHEEHNFDADFVEMMYIRYIYVLRNHHKCDHKVLVSVSSQFKDICVKKFGPSSAIAVRARLEYASVLFESESTKTAAIDIYEEIITISQTGKNLIDAGSLASVKKHLTEAYMYAHVHGPVSTAVVQRAILVLQERYEYIKNSLGCAHKETLTIFTELMLMHFKLRSPDHEKTIIQKLREIVIEIISKEHRSQVLFEAAGTIGAVYIACGIHSHGCELMHEIRQQVIADHTHESENSFKINKSVGRTCFVFLVAFELTLKGSVSHSYSEIMANWLTESVLYENYSRCFAGQTKIEILLMRSAHLRSFWAQQGRKEEIAKLDQQVLNIFFKQYGTIVKTKAEIVKIFLVSVLIHLGSRETYNIQIVRAASIAGNKEVLALLKARRFQEAREVGRCTFHFVMSQGGYHKPGIIGFGFKLAGYMAGRGAQEIPAEIHDKMLQTSREVMTEVLHACKDLDIKFSQLHDHELRDLVALLGEQENYRELEVILESLWKSRHGQKHWSEDTVIQLGARLIESRHLAAKAGHSHGAIDLAEDISYNLRRVLGGLHPHTLEISTLLSQLYTNARQYGDSINLHEEILQLIVFGDDGDDRTPDSVHAEVARTHLDLLKAAYQRNEGWVKSASTYKTLVNALLAMPQFRNATEFANVQPVQDWAPKQDKTTGQTGMFAKPDKWEFIIEEDIKGSENGRHAHTKGAESGVKVFHAPIKEKESGWSLRRVSENWGMSLGEKERKPGRRPTIVY